MKLMKANASKAAMFPKRKAETAEVTPSVPAATSSSYQVELWFS